MSDDKIAPDRKSKEIKKWMIDMELTAAEIGRKAGLSIHPAEKTINGKVNNKKILTQLVKLGCPIEYLALPRKFTDQMAA